MATMNISLPESLKAFVDDQVATRGYSTSSEFVRELIRREQDVQKFRALIQEGLESPLEGEADDAFFDDLHARIGRAAAE